MPRFQKYLHPVNTKKHVIDNQGGLTAGTPTTIEIAEGVDAPTLPATETVAVGSYVRSIFLNVQVAASQNTALANVYMIVYKNPSNAMAVPNANVVGASDTKKIIFHQEMIMVEKDNTGIPRTLFKGVLRVPKHMQRMGQDDSLLVQLFTPGVTFDYCLQCIYKEIR